MDKQSQKSELLSAISSAAIATGLVGIVIHMTGEFTNLQNERITCNALAHARNLTHERFGLSLKRLIKTRKEDKAIFVNEEFGEGPTFANEAKYCQDVWRITVTRGCAAQSVRKTLASGGQVPPLIIQDLKNEIGECKR